MFASAREGWHLIQHPVQAGDAFWLNIAALLFNLAVDGAILLKAMKEITKEAWVETKGLGFIPATFKHVSLSAPPTRLVLYEDLVAVSGALLAMIILSDKDVTDINDLRITQEGRYYHVDAMIELRRGLSLADADDIKFRVQEKLIMDPDITDVVLGIFEENGVIDWTPEILNEFS